MEKPKWIRCEEQLPELTFNEFDDKSEAWLESEDVFGLLEDGTIAIVAYQSATVHGDLPCWSSDAGKKVNVVAWCPAPDPLD